MNRPEVSAAESDAGHDMVRRALEVHMNNLYMPWQRHIGPADHYQTVRLAQAGQAHTAEKQHRESVEDITRRMAALTLNDVRDHDHNVMSVVRHRSIFRTDR